MTNLIGPKPEPQEEPRFPTPWKAEHGRVYTADGGRVLNISDRSNGLLNTEDERRAVAEFVAEAVNEKIERDRIKTLEASNAITFRTEPFLYTETPAPKVEPPVEYFESRDDDGRVREYYQIVANSEEADSVYWDYSREVWAPNGVFASTWVRKRRDEARGAWLAERAFHEVVPA